MMVPTVDTVRYGYITSQLVRNTHPVLLVGPVGTGKTSVAQSVCDKLDPKQYNVLTVNMSAQVRVVISATPNPFLLLYHGISFAACSCYFQTS